MNAQDIEKQHYNKLNNRFPYIQPWHKRTGSYEYYIRSMLDKANELDAPGDVIYFTPNNEPKTLRDVKNHAVFASLFPNIFNI